MTCSTTNKSTWRVLERLMTSRPKSLISTWARRSVRSSTSNSLTKRCGSFWKVNMAATTLSNATISRKAIWVKLMRECSSSLPSSFALMIFMQAAYQSKALRSAMFRSVRRRAFQIWKSVWQMWLVLRCKRKANKVQQPRWAPKRSACG